MTERMHERISFDDVEVYDLIEVKHMRLNDEGKPVEFWRVARVKGKPSREVLHVWYAATEENAHISRQQTIRRYKDLTNDH